ncbi:DUF5995 family protein [Leifsonia sp. Leaf264]|uniref:DUF5995 family protein n=1 Tax=Leifsonia sp. Leaf264 TaxID=1736314 RepID=UPI0006F1F74D|nr:DUF5995 family protein [Leifsonia sp. Leaf264]KQO96666.1 hypothetical protein ASF30_16290 [Leifsonia sp. Leaf264]
MAGVLTVVDPSTPIGKVVRDLDAVRAPLTRADGIAVFVDVYREVTALVAKRVTDRTFEDPDFIEVLDVVFAGLFLAVPKALAAGEPVSKAWEPLVERRALRLFPLQFALAGMNAHINHDLAVAVVKVCVKKKRDPSSGSIHADFVRINDVLGELVRPIRQSFLEKAVVEHGAAITPLADLLTNFSMEKARDAAWASALTLYAVRDVPFVRDLTRQTLASTVGLVGRQLLTPFDPLGRLPGR